MKILASLAAVLIVSAAAGAASAQEARIGWSDLDLASTVGAATFDARVDAAAQRMCRFAKRPLSLLSDREFCFGAVQREVLQQLPREARIDYARSRRAIVL